MPGRAPRGSRTTARDSRDIGAGERSSIRSAKARFRTVRRERASGSSLDRSGFRKPKASPTPRRGAETERQQFQSRGAAEEPLCEMFCSPQDLRLRPAPNTSGEIRMDQMLRLYRGLRRLGIKRGTALPSPPRPDFGPSQVNGILTASWACQACSGKSFWWTCCKG